MKVVYGHTDSIYVQIDTVEEALEKVALIEERVRKIFPNVMGLEEHPVSLEFEKFYDALGVGEVKNRNAGMISWEDGVFLDEPKFTMTGFTAKRVSETKLAKEVQTNVLKMWVSQCSYREITNYLYEKYTEVKEGKIDLSSIIKRSRLKENRFTVKCFACSERYQMQDIISMTWCERCGEKTSKFKTLDFKNPSIGSGIAGVLYALEHTDTKFDDSYLFLKVNTHGVTFTHPLTKEKKPVEYISASTYEEFDAWTPDYEHYAEQVVKKAEPIYSAMNWDVSSIRTNRLQLKLDEWW